MIGLAAAPLGNVLAQAAPPSPVPGTGTTQAPSQPGLQGCFSSQGLIGMAPFILIFVVFYFLLIRPQNKKQRELQNWLKSLKKGDDVVTSGGVIGRITGLTDNVITLEVQEKVRLRVLRGSITGKAPGTVAAAPESK